MGPDFKETDDPNTECFTTLLGFIDNDDGHPGWKWFEWKSKEHDTFRFQLRFACNSVVVNEILVDDYCADHGDLVKYCKECIRAFCCVLNDGGKAVEPTGRLIKPHIYDTLAKIGITSMFCYHNKTIAAFLNPPIHLTHWI